MTSGAASTIAERRDVLPLSCPPRGLSRVEAARYVGVSPSLFDQMVRDRRMPAPKRINARLVWDRLRLDAAFAALPDEGGETDANPWHELSLKEIERYTRAAARARLADEAFRKLDQRAGPGTKLSHSEAGLSVPLQKAQ